MTTIPFAKNTVREILCYGLVGVVNTLVGMSTIAILTYFDIQYLATNILGTLAGWLCSFQLNRTFTFAETSAKNSPSDTTKKKKRFPILMRQFFQFALGNGACFLISILCLSILVELVELPQLWQDWGFIGQRKMGLFMCQVASIFVYTSSGFIVNKFYVFRQKSGEEKRNGT